MIHNGVVQIDIIQDIARHNNRIRQNMSNETHQDPVMECIDTGDLNRLKNLKNIDFSKKKTYGTTYLDMAIMMKQEKIALFIINKGANIHGKDSGGWTALHNAVNCELLLVVKLLLSKKADIHAKTKSGFTAFNLARYNNYDLTSVLGKHQGFILGQKIDILRQQVWFRTY